MEINDAIGKIGKNIVKKRKQKKMTQQSLATQSGLSISYLRRVEHGTANASIDVLLRISSSLEIPVDSLVQTDFPEGQGD